MNKKIFDVIIVGGGQSGLLTAYYLKKTKLSYLVVDSDSRVGNSWRARYDSLKLLTPRSEDSLPGVKMKGNPKGYPSKDEIANYLEKYANFFSLPIKHKTVIKKVTKKNNLFVLQTKHENYFAKNVVIATGPFHKPFIPNTQQNLSKNFFNIHSYNYKNPNQIPPGKVLVVGAGDSGIQIAVELSKTHQVSLSSKNKLMFDNKWDLLYKLASKVFDDKLIKKFVELVKVKKVQNSLKDLIDKKIFLKKEFVAVGGNKFYFNDGSNDVFNCVIWATGFTFDFSFINIPNAFFKNAALNQKNGVSKVSGLYFIYPTKDYGFIKDLSKRVEFIVNTLIKNAK